MELSILRFIQSGSNSFWDSFFQGLTQLGEAIPLVALVLIVYWAINKEKGAYICYSLFVALVLTNCLKDVFKLPRPIGEAGIRSLRVGTATGYSFPSGHTTGASAFFSGLAIAFKKRYLRVLAVIVITLVGFSRMYLGVHYPKDVLGGLLVGLGCAFLCYFLSERAYNRQLLYLLTGIILLPTVFFADSADFVMSYGVYWGFALGALIEHKWVNFSTDVKWLRKILRVAIGLALLILIHMGLQAILPDLAIFAFIHFFIIGLFAIGIYPFVFRFL